MGELGTHHPFKSREARDRYLADYDRRAAEWPIRSETRMVPTGQGETLVRIMGPADGRPLVILNGIWSDSLMWPPSFIRAFVDRYRVYQMDNPWDFGRSVNAEARTSRADYMAWLGGVLDGLGLSDGTCVLGLSLGAWIAAEYALENPTRIGKMVWFSPGGVVAPKANVATVRGLPKSMAVLISPTVANVDRMFRWMMPDSASAEGEGKRTFEEYVASIALGLQCFAKRPVTMETNRRFSDPELRGLPMPILYIAGENEVFCPPAKTVERLNRAAPAIETAVVPGCGHDLIALEPEAAAERVLAFLDS